MSKHLNTRKKKAIYPKHTEVFSNFFSFRELKVNLSLKCNIVTVSHQCISCWHLSVCCFSLRSHQVHQFSNKQTEMALRVASLDYLGTVAARLRKDAVTSKMDQRSIDRILQEVEEQLHLWWCHVHLNVYSDKNKWNGKTRIKVFKFSFSFCSKICILTVFAEYGLVWMAHLVIFLSDYLVSR